jgi:hypothetical protein
MPNQQSILRHIANQRKLALAYLLPDFCTIIPSEGENVTISASGVMETDTPVPRRWRNPQGLDQENIPCRLTIERAFVPAKLSAQQTVASRYVLELPVSMRYDQDTNPNGVKSTDHIHKGGLKFEIRKIADQSQWDVTLELTVVELGVEYDHL